MRFLPVLALAVTFQAALATGAHAQKDFVVIWTPEGPFTSTVEMGPGCADSPIQMCTHGLLEGELAGTYEFSFDSIIPSPTADDPSRILFTGHSVITLDDGGILLGDDEGVMTGTNPFATQFITRVTVFQGIGLYAGVSGTVTATGDIDFVNNWTVGSYTSELHVLCPKDNRNHNKHQCRELGPRAND